MCVNTYLLIYLCEHIFIYVSMYLAFRNWAYQVFVKGDFFFLNSFSIVHSINTSLNKLPSCIC